MDLSSTLGSLDSTSTILAGLTTHLAALVTAEDNLLLESAKDSISSIVLSLNDSVVSLQHLITPYDEDEMQMTFQSNPDDRHESPHSTVVLNPSVDTIKAEPLPVHGIEELMYNDESDFASPSSSNHHDQQPDSTDNGFLTASLACPVCLQVQRNRTALNKHLSSHEKPLVCPVGKLDCASFDRYSSLVSHLKEEHTRAYAIAALNSYECPSCDYVATRRSDLTRHIAAVHCNQRPHVCETCGRAFSQRENLARHMRLHTGIREFHCKLCYYGASDRRRMRIHMRTTHGEEQMENYETKTSRIPS